MGNFGELLDLIELRSNPKHPYDAGQRNGKLAFRALGFLGGAGLAGLAARALKLLKLLTGRRKPRAVAIISERPDGSTTKPNRVYSARELLRRAEEPGPFHNFPESFNKPIFETGNQTVIPDFFNKSRTGLSNDAIQYRLLGTVNGRDGVFEIFTRPSVSGNTEVIMHRFFRPNP